MKLVKFSEQSVVYAENQPEYLPLPAYQYNDEQGQIAFCWQCTWRDRLRILFTGKIWHRVLTFRQPLQPQMLQSEKPDMGGGDD